SSWFRRAAAATDAKRRPGFQTNTLAACAPQTRKCCAIFSFAFIRVFRGLSRILSSFRRAAETSTPAARAPQRLRPTRPPLQQNASAKRDGYNSRRNFADLSVLPNDHAQTALPKFGAFLFRRAAMRLRCGFCFRKFSSSLNFTLPAPAARQRIAHLTSPPRTQYTPECRPR